MIGAALGSWHDMIHSEIPKLKVDSAASAMSFLLTV